MKWAFTLAGFLRTECLRALAKRFRDGNNGEGRPDALGERLGDETTSGTEAVRVPANASVRQLASLAGVPQELFRLTSNAVALAM